MKAHFSAAVLGSSIFFLQSLTSQVNGTAINKETNQILTIETAENILNEINFTLSLINRSSELNLNRNHISNQETDSNQDIRFQNDFRKIRFIQTDNLLEIVSLIKQSPKLSLNFNLNKLLKCPSSTSETLMVLNKKKEVVSFRPIVWKSQCVWKTNIVKSGFSKLKNRDQIANVAARINQQAEKALNLIASYHDGQYKKLSFIMGEQRFFFQQSLTQCRKLILSLQKTENPEKISELISFYNETLSDIYSFGILVEQNSIGELYSLHALHGILLGNDIEVSKSNYERMKI